jgi:hypothetical protein
MSTENADRQQLKVTEFMRLLPLTLAIAGLAEVEPGKRFSEDQMEARATSIRAAYKVARAVILDLVK